jgi:hypothetical protein
LAIVTVVWTEMKPVKEFNDTALRRTIFEQLENIEQLPMMDQEATVNSATVK